MKPQWYTWSLIKGGEFRSIPSYGEYFGMFHADVQWPEASIFLPRLLMTSSPSSDSVLLGRVDYRVRKETNEPFWDEEMGKSAITRLQIIKGFMGWKFSLASTEEVHLAWDLLCTFAIPE